MAGKIVQLKNNKGENIYPLGATDWSTMIDKVYPVGSIYMSVNDVSPSTFFGGTWERIQDKFLLSAGSTYSAGSSGGSPTHSHTIKIKRRMWYSSTLESTTNHSFDIVDENGNVGSYSQGAGQFASASMSRNSGTNSSNTTFTHDGFGQTAQGSSFSASSMPPYLAVYMWKRTA